MILFPLFAVKFIIVLHTIRHQLCINGCVILLKLKLSLQSKLAQVYLETTKKQKRFLQPPAAADTLLIENWIHRRISSFVFSLDVENFNWIERNCFDPFEFQLTSVLFLFFLHARNANILSVERRIQSVLFS